MKNLFIFCLFFISITVLFDQIIIFAQSEQYAAYYAAKIIDSSNGLPISLTLITADGADSTYSEYGKFVLGFLQSAFSDSLTIHPVVRFSNPYFQEFSKEITISKGDSLVGADIMLIHIKPVLVKGHVFYNNKDMNPQVSILFYGLKSASSSWAYPDSNGNYSTQIYSEPYYVSCTINYNFVAYRTKYYNNKLNLSTADILVVKKDTSGINFTFPTIYTGTISGKVTDKVLHQPISNAWLTLGSNNPSDSSFTSTDQDGNYSMKVLEGDYFLLAGKLNYYQQFYKNAQYSFDAIPVKVDSNNLKVTGIDFSLIKEELGSNSIVGYVKESSSDTNLSNVEVYAIPLSEGIETESNTDINGRYELSHMVNGEYILLFNKMGFNSEYYDHVYKWEDASVLNLNGNKIINIDDVYLTKMDIFGGEISGKISSGLDSALSGTLISAINTSDSVISTSISSYDGSYTIPSLVNGDYIIQASKINYNTTKYTNKIKVDLNNQPAFNGINIAINTTGIADKNNKRPNSFSLYQNYPNPFNPSTTISYIIPYTSIVTIKVYDILGREISTLIKKNELPGKHSVYFNATKLSSGIYFYTFRAVSINNQSENFIQSMKMILLK